ncbi:MAG TPA: DUF3857 domain-containing protein [Acetobacteraceae bacterium]|jgi:hypothetical protein|nr:DUF3857 domain-containing protein [Acetobacteraceae bacterium]
MRPLFLAAALTFGVGRAAFADTVVHARLDLSAVSYEVHHDLTSVQTVEEDHTLLTERGLRMRERSTVTFNPKSQEVEILEAWVTEPDGTRVPVEPTGMFTRPSAASQSAPGFVGSLTTTVLFPQLREGSQTHVKWRRVQKTPPLLGFNVWDEAEYELPTTLDEVDITMPADIAFHWADRGGFVTTDTVQEGVRHIHSAIRDNPGHEREPNTVATSDFQPLFVGTTMPDLGEIGTIYNHAARDKAVVTPDIATLAAKIAGDRRGLEAARAVYDWVASNIRYVAVYLDPNDGWVPHAAAEVLRNGYGDCKDHVALMQALLAARGIAAEAAIINWGERTRDVPVPHPGQFNHVIVYLPAYDVYANPTNQFGPFESFDHGLAGKTVVIASDPGRAARTPASRPSDNAYRFVDHVRLHGDGTLDGSVTVAVSANGESMMRGAVANAPSLRDLAQRLLRNTPEGGFGELHTSDPRDLAHPLGAEATWTSPHGVPFQGRFAYMQIPIGPDFRPVVSMRNLIGTETERRTPMTVGAADSRWITTLTVPDATTIVALPRDLDVRNTVGSYVATYERTANGLTVTRHLTLDHDVYQASAYPDLCDLLYAAMDDARAVVMLEREERADR